MSVQETVMCDSPNCDQPGVAYTIMTGDRIGHVDLCAEHAETTGVLLALTWSKPPRAPTRAVKPRTADREWLAALPNFDEQEKKPPRKRGPRKPKPE